VIFVTNLLISRKTNIFESKFDKIYRRIQELSFVVILSLIGFIYCDSVYDWFKYSNVRNYMVIVVMILAGLNIIFELAIVLKNMVSGMIEAIKSRLKKKNKIEPEAKLKEIHIPKTLI
jgi:hypothetical protein